MPATPPRSRRLAVVVAVSALLGVLLAWSAAIAVVPAAGQPGPLATDALLLRAALMLECVVIAWGLSGRHGIFGD